MWTLWAAVASTAMASVSPSNLEEVVSNSRAIVRGHVLSSESCIAQDQGRAWTFVTLQVHQTLRGRVQAPGGTLTVRMPGGSLGGGQRNGVLGMPSLSPGEHVFLALTARSNGTAGFVPFADLGASVFRIVPMPSGQVAVVDGLGRPVFEGPRGPVNGIVLEQLTADLVFGQTFSMNQAVGVLDDFDVPPVSLLGPAEGPWSGGVSLRLGGELQGSRREGRCEGRLDGSLEQGVLHAAGSCNAPFVGATDLDLVATPVNNGWSVELTATPAGYPNEARTVTTFLPDMRPDTLTGMLHDLDVGPEPVETGGSLWMTWRGERPLMHAADFMRWMRDTSAAHPDHAGGVRNTPMTQATCNTTLQLRPIQ